LHPVLGLLWSRLGGLLQVDHDLAENAYVTGQTVLVDGGANLS
jgi:hypothetical protein